jgi:PhoH-like ATPase
MSKQNKLIVLDTNVIMHDPTCIFEFKENDVLIPMCVLEELDGHKKGMSGVAPNVRQFLRTIKELMRNVTKDSMSKGIALPKRAGKASGRLFFQTEHPTVDLPASLAKGKADNNILQVVLAEQFRNKTRQVILVTKDIHLTIKATTLGIIAEDYTTDNVVDDKDVLTSSGVYVVTLDAFNEMVVPSEEGNEKNTTIGGPLAKKLHVNEFVVVQQENDPPHHYRVVLRVKNTAVLSRACTHRSSNHSVYGIVAKNTEQSCALDLLMDPEIHLVTLFGIAGTGKTLLTLAAAMEQSATGKQKRYEEIIVTRATIPMGEDIGFLPGTEEEKMTPWFGALEDNMRVLLKDPPAYDKYTVNGKHDSDWPKKATGDVLGKYLKVKNMSYMRGRTFQNKFVIIDEAQNLTPKQMKALITRAGPGTKVVCMGNLSQIDSPFITEWNSGLTNVVMRFRGWPRYGSILLKTGERSELADYANEAL